MLLEQIRRIEPKVITKDPEWYYHGIVYKRSEFMDMLICGLKCANQLGVKACGSNGKYYISLSKDIPNKLNSESAYMYMKFTHPMFILDNVKAYKCTSSYARIAFINSQIPLRYSTWDDEYQAYSRITPDHFVGMECPLEDWTNNIKYYKNIALLKDLRDMIITMNELGINLPIYDSSHELLGQLYEIDKEKYLHISKTL